MPPAVAPPPPGVAPPPSQYGYVAPPPGATVNMALPAHAPRYSLWLGGRLGVLAYGGGLYQDPNGYNETTGNFVSNGLAVEVNAGARIERRYIPYVALELGLVAPGHRFDNTQANAGTSFLGFGIRLLAGDVDNVAFASELSFGWRKFQVSRGDTDETWSATGFEYLRLGLGAEIRLSTLFTLTPMVTLATGTLTDSSGSITFAPNQGDNQAGAPHFNGQIPPSIQTSYQAFVVGCGAHFDLLGR